MASRAPKLLIVDDEAIIVRFLRDLINTNLPDIVIETARTGIDAVALAQTFLPDLVLLDLNIPKGDGFFVCSSLRKESVFEKTPIVVFTSDGDPKRRQQILDLGANECLPKPFPFSELLTKIYAYVSQGDEELT